MSLLSLWSGISNNPFKLLLILTCIGLLGWLIFATMVLVISPKLMFNTKAKEAALDVPYQQLWLTNAQNHKIDTVWIENPQATQVVLYLHGNRGRLSHFFPPLMEKYSILAPAYPGYNNSSGSPNSANIYSTALYAYDYLLQQGYSEDQIIIFGHSLGGAPAVYTAAQRPNVGKLVLANTFNSIYDMCTIGWSVGCIFLRSVLNSANYAPYVLTKVRVFHVPNDEVIPYAQGEKLFTHFTGTTDKKFITLSKTDTHRDFDILQVVSTE